MQGWPAILGGGHTLVCAPTGSGKTLTAFLASIDRLVTTPPADPKARTRVLYISPLRALAFDVEKNLRAPLMGIALAAERLGVPLYEPTVAMRTGDTSARDRAALGRRPVDLLITTPESLYLMLTSNVRDTLVNVDTVIIDEIHAMATTKRGAHLMLSLERLEELTEHPPQRIGLSATQRPLEEIAHFLGGHDDAGVLRPVTIVDAGVRKPLELEVVVPVEDMGDLQAAPVAPPVPGVQAVQPRGSIWPSIYPRILAQVLAHQSTIIFCNGRRQAERLAARLNELYDEQTGAAAVADEWNAAAREAPATSRTEGAAEAERRPVPTNELVKAHHGSLAREQRIVVEDQLKRGQLRGIVATSSLELGIDMGAVDLVIQVESPGAVARGLQRIGRAGHSVGEPSRGSIYPKHRGDLLEAAVVTRRMVEGLIESSRFLRNPLDVLAQQIVAHVAMTPDAPVGDVARLVRRCACFHEISEEQLNNTLDLLAGRYPSEEFSELRPRIVWDRVAGTLRARDGSKRLAVTSGGTIPDRGLFGVFLPDGVRVGELDEEMVYESRPGETFLLGASTWRIEDITFERVVVTPAPGEPGKMPFWHGDRPGRPLELGRALGAFQREIRAMPAERATATLMEHHALDAFAANNVLLYLDEQAQATGVVPDDRTIVIERFRDEIGDWRVCILSPFGTPVHAPWAMAIERRLMDRFDLPVETMWGDDGIVLRLPEAADELPVDALVIDPDEIDELVVGALPQTSLFSARFRECAARALLLPRRRPDRRTPLWQQRQRAADLLAVAAKYPTFPILLETSRECLQDVFDLPALRDVLGQLRSRSVKVVTVDTAKASPFAQSLLFNWIANYMYEGDAPLAERRAAALALDRDLLRDLLGAEELRELLDPAVLADVELELQCLADGRRARSADELHDVLRKVGDLTEVEADLRSEGDGPAWLAELVRARRAVRPRRRRRAAHDRRRGRGALPRRARLLAAARSAASVHRAGGPPAGVARRPLRPHPQPVRHRRRRPPAGHPGRAGHRGARRAGGRGPGGARRVPAAGQRAGVVRRRRPAPAAPPLAGDAAPRGRARRPGGLRPLRPVVARHARRAAGDGGAGRVARPAAGCRARRLHAGVRGARRPPARLPPGGPRRAVHVRRRRVGRRRWARCQRRPGAPVLRRPAPAARRVRRAGRATRRPAARRDPRPAGAARCQLLAPAARRRAVEHRLELLAALWDLVWAGEVTNDSLAPLRALLGSKRTAKSGTAHLRQRPRPGRLNRIGPPAGAGRWSLVEPLLHPPPTRTRVGPRRGPAAAGALRRRHPRGGAGRGRGRRVRLGVRRAQGAGGARPGAARLLRRRPRRRPVRRPRRGRPPPCRPRASRRRAAPGAGARPGGARRHRSRLSRTGRRCRGPSRPGARRATPARSSCSVPASRWCGSTVAPATSSPSRRRPTTRGGPRRWPRWSRTGGRAASRSRS